MKRHTIVKLISILLIILWVYASSSKLFHYADFLVQLGRQPLAKWLIPGISIGLPVLELMTAFLLCFRWTRKAGLWLSFGLMACFTLYVALALSGVFGEIPCSCGGILNSMGWKTHVVFNICYTIIAFMGIYLINKNKELNVHIRKQSVPE